MGETWTEARGQLREQARLTKKAKDEAKAKKSQERKQRSERQKYVRLEEVKSCPRQLRLTQTKSLSEDISLLKSEKPRMHFLQALRDHLLSVLAGLLHLGRPKKLQAVIRNC